MEFYGYDKRWAVAIEAANKMVTEYVEEGGNLFDALMSGELSKLVRSNQCSRSITAKAALATVLTSGIILSNGEFLHQSTVVCLDNFKQTRKALSDGKRLTVTVGKGLNVYYYTI